MHYSKALFPIIALTLPFSQFVSKSYEEIIINTKAIGPYKRYQKSYIQSQVKNNQTYSRSLNYKILGSCDLFKNRLIYASQFLTYQPGETKFFNTEIDNNYFLDSGFTFSFLVYKSADVLLKRINVFIKPLKTRYVDLDNNNELAFSTGTFKVIVEDNKIRSLDEDSLSFYPLGNTLLSPTYLTLPIDQIKAYWTADHPFNYSSAYLSYIDENKLFKHLHKSLSSSIIEIPLVAKLISNIIIFQLRGDMFVNPNTMEMSFSKLDNFIPTNQFFLPSNGKNILNNAKFVFHFNEVGSSKSSYSKTLTYSFNKGIIGDCNNNDFCVIGGVDNG